MRSGLLIPYWIKIDSNNTVDVADDIFVITALDSINGKLSQIRFVFPYNKANTKYVLSPTLVHKAYYSADINGTEFSCNSNSQNFIKLIHDENRRMVQATFKFYSKDFDLIDKGKFVTYY